MFKDLKTTSHEFVRIDDVTGPLQNTYEDPFQVISRADKTYVVWLIRKDKHISIDRLNLPTYSIPPTKAKRANMRKYCRTQRAKHRPRLARIAIRENKCLRESKCVRDQVVVFGSQTAYRCADKKM